jgi:hypothetical protein
MTPVGQRAEVVGVISAISVEPARSASASFAPLLGSRPMNAIVTAALDNPLATGIGILAMICLAISPLFKGRGEMLWSEVPQLFKSISAGMANRWRQSGYQRIS